MISLEEILERYPFVQREDLIPILQDIQDKFGYLSEESIVMVGKHLSLPTAKIYGLASFYHHFRFTPRGKYHIKICNGTSCYANSNKLIIGELTKILGIKNEETTKDGMFSMEEVACLAACGEGPVMMVNDNYHTHLSIQKVVKIIDSYKSLEE